MHFHPPFVVLDDAKADRVMLFSEPVRVLRADDAASVPHVLAAMGEALAAGFFLAGAAAYELGAALEPRLVKLLPARPPAPFLSFGVFPRPPVALDGSALDCFWGEGRAHASALRPEWTEAEHARRVASVQRLIEAGDIFQANLTFRARFNFIGNPRALYRDLRREGGAKHGAYLDDGERVLLSVSPELFFAIEPSGLIHARPMKGTAPRGLDVAQDEKARAALATSVKDRAENLMIVDLLRSDLGRIAELGSVRVDELFTIETYPTLHTMVSTISARLRQPCGLERLFSALFPCGSITGAPKIRAMEIIAALESSARGAYCGAIGMFAPDGSASLNVAIRTISLRDGIGELGLGGAITTDSCPAAEWSEALLKARFFERARRPMRLFETLRHEAGRFIRLDRHLSRLGSSAATFGFPYDENAAHAALTAAIAGRDGALRIRLQLEENGTLSAVAALLKVAPALWRCCISTVRNASGDVLLQHKTDRREVYDNERELAGTDEVLFLNERGELCEGSRSNVFLAIGGRLLTPPARVGLLQGCLRGELLETGRAVEAILNEADVARADRIWLGSSLRGLLPAVLV